MVSVIYDLKTTKSGVPAHVFVTICHKTFSIYVVKLKRTYKLTLVFIKLWPIPTGSSKNTTVLQRKWEDALHRPGVVTVNTGGAGMHSLLKKTANPDKINFATSRVTLPTPGVQRNVIYGCRNHWLLNNSTFKWLSKCSEKLLGFDLVLRGRCEVFTPPRSIYKSTATHDVGSGTCRNFRTNIHNKLSLITRKLCLQYCLY